MAKRAKKIVCFSICIIILCMNFIPVKAEALPEILCGNSTIADTVMSMYAMSGAAVGNSEWINTLYDSLGSSFGTLYDLAENGMLTVNADGTWSATTELTDAIANSSAYTSLGLDQVFNISAEEALAGGGAAAASGAATLSGAVAGVGSTGVIPVLGAVTAAYWGGIALGTLVAHLTGLYGKDITLGNPINKSQISADVPAGSGSIYYYADTGNGSIANEVVYFNGGIGLCVYYMENETYCYYSTFYIPNASGSVYGYRKSYIYNQTYNQRFNFSSGLYTSGLTRANPANYAIFNLPIPNRRFENSQSVTDYFNGIRNGSIVPKVFSPDVIGSNGNQEGQYSQDNGYTVPDMKPEIDPGQEAGRPLSLEEWLAFANAVKNNNNNADPSAANKDLFDSILDAIKTPNTGGDPDPNPDPWSPPVVTPVPDPSYPDPVPDQQITENPNESENPQQTENPIDTGKPWRLPDLRQKFPFCIPWDIAKIFSKLKVNARQAPHISWRFNPPSTPIDYTFNLDLEDFEDVATLLRTLELMGFIVGLAFVTRYLIGAN